MSCRLLTQLLENPCKKFGRDREVALAYLNLILVGSLRILESNRSKISQASVRVGGYISIENNLESRIRFVRKAGSRSASKWKAGSRFVWTWCEDAHYHNEDTQHCRSSRNYWARARSVCQCCRFSLLSLGSGSAQESRILIRIKVIRTRRIQIRIQTNSDPKDWNTRTRTSFHDFTQFLEPWDGKASPFLAWLRTRCPVACWPLRGRQGPAPAAPIGWMLLLLQHHFWR